MNNNDLLKEQKTKSFYTLLFRYLSYWPWILCSIFTCCIGMFLFISYVPSVYNITSSVLIKVSDQNRNPIFMNDGIMTGSQNLGMFSMTSKFENEVEVLSSRTLIQKVVYDLGLYIEVEEKGLWGYKPLYKNSPINIYMTPQEADNLNSELELQIKYSENGNLYVKAEYVYIDKFGDKQEIEEEKSFNVFPAILPTKVGTISFTRNDSVEILSEDKSVQLRAYINSPLNVASDYKKNKLIIKPSSQMTTIALISVENTVKERGIDFVNCLIDNYNKDANDEKNEVAQKSADFIEERLEIINQELSSTENQLVSFKQQSGLTNLTNDTQIALEENAKYEQKRIENSTQIRLVEYLQEYINNPKNRNEVIPLNIGLENADLNTIITRYNDLQLERKRLLRTSSEANPTVINLNTSLNAMFLNVQTMIHNVLENLWITQSDLDKQAHRYEIQINKVPQKEKEFLTISRQQELKASLYSMLLQKREENAITLASTAKNGRVIESAAAGNKPIFPRNLLFMIAAFGIGLIIPIGMIYFRDYFKYKIEDIDDVKEKIDVPICEIPFEKWKTFGGIVLEKSRNIIIDEAFRILRTNLLFRMNGNNKVILVTSNMPGEGKTFIAGNLAVSLSFLNKKVIIVGVDLRKPGLNKVLNVPNTSKGLVNYLEGTEHVQLSELIQTSSFFDGLDILTSGSIPSDPTELLAKKDFSEIIEQLKERYDYVILDTAPISLVADTSLITHVADLSIYVCRMDYTPKESLDNIQLLRNQDKKSEVICVLNGIDMNKRKHSYKYKYGKRYGYRYGY